MPQYVLFANESCLRKMLVSFFSSNIPLYIEKNPVEKLCKVLEMDLKTYTPIGPKFGFEKIKFKMLHDIQHDFIRPTLSKDQTNIFKIFLRTHSIKNDKYLFFVKVGVATVLLKLNYYKVE